MNSKKIIILLLIFIGLTMTFFSYQVVITHDSSHYLYLSNVFEGNVDISEWDVGRGPVFPGFIRICTLLFGKSPNGLLVGMYIFYLLMLLGCYLIYKDTIKKGENVNKKFLIFLGVLFFILIAINPMIFGYYHTLLTEFIAITLSIIGCYLAWKWMNINFMENKVKYILFTALFAFLTAFSWQLKQPNISTIFFPILIASIISVIKSFSWKNVLQRVITILVCVIVVLVGSKVWNAVLEGNGAKMDEDRSSSSFIANGILSGLEGYDTRTNVMSTGDAIKHWFNEFGKQPFEVMKKYVVNYLATISVLHIDFDGMKIIINDKIDVDTTVEIGGIAHHIYEYGNECVFPILEKFQPYVSDYRVVNKPIVAINWVMRELIVVVTVIMKLCYLVLPILVILSIVYLVRSKKRYNEKFNNILDIITILFAYSLLNIILYAFLGSTIDRYTMPSLVTTYMAIILSIYAFVNRKKYKIQ